MVLCPCLKNRWTALFPLEPWLSPPQRHETPGFHDNRSAEVLRRQVSVTRGQLALVASCLLSNGRNPKHSGASGSPPTVKNGIDMLEHGSSPFSVQCHIGSEGLPCHLGGSSTEKLLCIDIRMADVAGWFPSVASSAFWIEQQKAEKRAHAIRLIGSWMLKDLQPVNFRRSGGVFVLASAPLKQPGLTTVRSCVGPAPNVASLVASTLPRPASSRSS